MKGENLRSGLRQRSEGVDRGEFASASGEFLKRQAIIQSLRRTGDDVRQAGIRAEVRRRTHSCDPVHALRMAKRPAVADQAAVTVRQHPSPLVQAVLGDELLVELL